MATITNSNGAVGRLLTNAFPAGAQTVTVLIADELARSASTIAMGGVAFDPLTVGSTRVSATIPGFTSTVAANKDVAVSE